MATEIGILAVRRSILIQATPERVWEEFTSFEKMKAWFGLMHDLTAYEPRLGGEVVTEVNHGDTHMRISGKIIAFEASRELTFETEMEGAGWEAPPLLTFRLTPVLGGTLVELIHHAIERIGPDAAEMHRGFEGSWTPIHLEALREIVEA